MPVHAIFAAILLMLSAGPDSQPQSRPEDFPNAQKLLDELKTRNSNIDLVSKEKFTIEDLQGRYSVCGPTMKRKDPLIDNEFHFLLHTMERTKTFTEEESRQTQEDLVRYNGTWKQRPKPTSKPSSTPTSTVTDQN